jgi:hypothetical protein
VAVTHESPDLDALVFSGRTTEADALATLRCENATVLRPSLQWLARGVAAFLAAAIVFVIAKRGPELGTLLGLAVCVYIAVVLPWERELWIRWRYRRRTEEESETTVRLSANRLLIESELLRMEFAWSLIQLAVDHRAGVLLCSWPGRGIVWLPERVLADGGRERVLLLVSGKGIAVRRN